LRKRKKVQKTFKKKPEKEKKARKETKHKGNSHKRKYLFIWMITEDHDSGTFRVIDTHRKEGRGSQKRKKWERKSKVKKEEKKKKKSPETI
jgi:hypothetical protein